MVRLYAEFTEGFSTTTTTLASLSHTPLLIAAHMSHLHQQKFTFFLGVEPQGCKAEEATRGHGA